MRVCDVCGGNLGRYQHDTSRQHRDAVSAIRVAGRGEVPLLSPRAAAAYRSLGDVSLLRDHGLEQWMGAPLEAVRSAAGKAVGADKRALDGALRMFVELRSGRALTKPLVRRESAYTRRKRRGGPRLYRCSRGRFRHEMREWFREAGVLVPPHLIAEVWKAAHRKGAEGDLLGYVNRKGERVCAVLGSEGDGAVLRCEVRVDGAVRSRRDIWLGSG